MVYLLNWIEIHPFTHPFVDGATLKCNVRAHPRIVAPKLVFPSRPRATCVSLLKWGSTRAPARDRGQFV